MQKAYLDGEELLAFALDRGSTVRVQAAQRDRAGRLIDDLGEPVVLRAGEKNTWHFARRHGQSAPESARHIALKAAVHAAASVMEWRPSVEHRAVSGAWIADVLTEDRSGRRIAWEVQLSGQSEGEYLRRTQRYAEEGIETIWITSRAPMSGVLSITPEESDVGSLVLLMSWLADIGPVEATAEAGTGYAIERCYRCEEVYAFRSFSDPWKPKAGFSERQQEALIGSGRAVAYRRRAYSKSYGGQYDAWHCPRCNALQGDYFLSGRCDRVLLASGVDALVPAKAVLDLADEWALQRHGDLG